jgi:polyisoprenoid-binding protein YceI
MRMIEIKDDENSVLIDLDEVLWVMEEKLKKTLFFKAKEYTTIHFRSGEEVWTSIPYASIQKALTVLKVTSGEIIQSKARGG